MLRNIASGLRSLFRKEHVDRELNEELRTYLEMASAEKIKQGMSRKDAVRAVRLERGSLEVTKEVVRSAAWESFVETCWRDLQFAARMLRKNPGFTTAAVLAIALGVGINVGIFSVLNGAMLRLLPIPRAKQIVSVDQTFHGRFQRDTHGETSMFSYAEYLDYRDHNQVFSGLLAYEPFIEATLAGGKLQRLLGTASTCNYFEVLDEHPAQGRGFVGSDCAAPGENAVVVIGDALWKGTFGGDPALVGKRILLNRAAFTVIGITRPGFTGTEPFPSAFWAPITMQKALDSGRDYLASDNVSWLAILGRVRPGVTMQQVRADLGVIAGRIDQSHPGRTTSLGIARARFFSRADEREVLVPVASVIFAAFGLVLLIACANVANLLLARASVRHREIALRLSIGASRGRLVRQLLTESLLLSLFGGALGSVLALCSFASITRFVVSRLPHEFSTLTVNVAPDFRVLAYALALTVFTGIVFGLVPALKSSRLDLNTALKEDSAHSGEGKKGGLVRSTLVGAQIAVCMILLLASGLLLRGLYYAQTVDPGFEVKDIAGAFLNLRAQGYDESRATAFVQGLRERIAALPGVFEVAQAECAPLSHDWSADEFTVPGRTDKTGIEYNHVSPEYFSVVGIPIVRGRGFTQAEARNDATVIIVTESTAQRLWPGQDPLGKTLRAGNGYEATVIGVARDAQVSHLGQLNDPYLYYSAGPRDNLRTYVLLRFAGGYPTIAKGIRQAVHALDADVPVDINTVDDYLEVWRIPSRIVAALSTGLSGLALLLGSIGIYGMVSYGVSRCVREIGIRMALGADGADVMNLVLRQAMRPVLIGALVGMIACAVVSQVLSSMLFGVSAHDAIAFISAPLILLVVALGGSYIPARRAMRVDPMVALRYE